MATVSGATSVTQVRPWALATGGVGAWNNVAIAPTAAKTAVESTSYGVTLPNGYGLSAVQALDEWMNMTGAGLGASTATARAQKRLHALGLEASESAALATAQAGNGVTTNVYDRGGQSGPAQVVIVTTVGATPTCTYQLEGSPDGTTWNPLSSADSGTPTAFSTTTFVITTATTTTRIVNPASGSARFIRLTMSANTNVTNTITVQVNG